MIRGTWALAGHSIVGLYSLVGVVFHYAGWNLGNEACHVLRDISNCPNQELRSH